MKSKEIRVSKIGNRRGMIAELYCEDVLIYDIASALEVAMTTSYETDSDRLILNKEMIEIISIILIVVHCIAIFASIFAVERKLKRNFDKEGKRI